MPDDYTDDGGIEVLNDEGNFTEEFYNQFSEEDRPTVSRYKNPAELGKSNVELRRKFNAPADRMLIMPGDDASDVERQEFWSKLGVPETTEGYKYTKSDTISEKTEFDEGKIKAFAEIAKKYNLTPEQYNGVANDYLALVDKDINDFDSNMEIQKEQNRVKAEEILKAMLGKSCDERCDRVNVILKKYSGLEIKGENEEDTKTVGEKLMESYPGIENSPWLTIIFDAIANDMSEDRIKGIAGVKTPTDGNLNTGMKKLRDTPGYYDASHPDHRDIMRKRDELIKMKG